MMLHVKFDDEIISISFHYFSIILAYKDYRSHYLKSIHQISNISMLLLFTLYIFDVTFTIFIFSKTLSCFFKTDIDLFIIINKIYKK